MVEAVEEAQAGCGGDGAADADSGGGGAGGGGGGGGGSGGGRDGGGWANPDAAVHAGRGLGWAHRSMKRGVGAERILGPKVSSFAATASALASPRDAPYHTRACRVGKATRRMVASALASPTISSSSSSAAAPLAAASSATVTS